MSAVAPKGLRRENSRRLNLWEYKDEHHDSVTTDLENRFGVSGEKGLADQLEQIASKLVTEYWNDNRCDILGILADSFLEEYDDYNVEVAFRNAATVSTTYALMSRCGLNPGDYFEHEDFLSVFDFNTRDTIAVLGSAVSNSSEQILTLSESETKPLGKYGRMRKKYLQENRPVLWNSMILSETLYPHLREIDKTANRRLEQMMPELMKQNGVTEELKASDPMMWTGLMNNLKHQAEEVILEELIHS
mgnify:CR=1 FL=1